MVSAVNYLIPIECQRLFGLPGGVLQSFINPLKSDLY